MLPCWRFRNAVGISCRRALMNSLRVARRADEARGLHTRTIDEASALLAKSRGRPGRSVLTGHVPVMLKPAPDNPSSIASQPVETLDSVESLLESSVSVCLKA